MIRGHIKKVPVTFSFFPMKPSYSPGLLQRSQDELKFYRKGLKANELENIPLRKSV